MPQPPPSGRDNALDRLRQRLDGEVRGDQLTRHLYSTDGSVYEIEPIGVAFPRHETDVLAIVAWANEHGTPLLPRGAATSLAGQTVGRALILDFTKHMDQVLGLGPADRRMVVQPGIVCDTVNDNLATYGLQFAPDPSTSNRATIGGMVGNNAAGARSIKYGTTVDHIASLRVILANGEIMETGPLALDGPELAALVAGTTLTGEIYRTVLAVTREYADEINTRFPDLPRNVSGYRLNGLVSNGRVDLTRLFCGSEGTLGIITAATLKLVPIATRRALAVFAFANLVTAVAAVEPLRARAVSALEVIDGLLLDLARQTPYRAAIASLPAETRALLLVEVEGDDQDEVTRQIDAIGGMARQLGALYAEVRDEPAAQQQIWNMRKAAVPLLYRLPGDPKPVPFIEDMAVPPAVLPAYVRGLEELFARHRVDSVIYAHAGAGCLHLRPILNLKDADDVERMARIAGEACKLVMSLGGVMSGEHGDGLARSQWNRFIYGDRLWAAFGRIKGAFDPRGLLNPGKVFADDGDLTRDLRYGPEYPTVDWSPAQDFSPWGSFQQAVELCNGCGLCRKTTGTMCPTFRALDEEIMTTRGRANLIRGALTGKLGPDALFSDEFQRQVLDYCIGCKGCRSECPAGVDMARIKTEILHHRHQRQSAPWRSRLLADLRRLYRWGSAAAPMSNWLARGAMGRLAVANLLGVDQRRSLPKFSRERFSALAAQAGLVPAAAQPGAARRRVLLFPDCFTEFTEPDLGLAAVRVLERAGCQVYVPPTVACCGRPAISEGMLDVARTFMQQNVTRLLPFITAGWDLVVLEPSCTTAFRHELRELLGFGHEGARQLAARTFDVTEYLAQMLAAGELDHLRRDGQAADGTDGIGGGTDSTGGGTDSAGGGTDSASGGTSRRAGGIDDAADLTGAGGAAARATMILNLPAPVDRLTYHGHCHQKSLPAHRPTAAVLAAVTGLPVDVIDSGCCGMAGYFGYQAEHFDFSAQIAAPVRQAIEASGGTLVVSGSSCRTQFNDLYGWAALHPVAVLDRFLSIEISEVSSGRIQ